MTTVDLFQLVRKLLDTASSGEDLVRQWLRAAAGRRSAGRNSFEAFVPSVEYDSIVDEMSSASETLSKKLPRLIKPAHQALWLGLFQADGQPRSKDSLVTYISLSTDTSRGDKEWQSKAKPRPSTYLALPVLSEFVEKAVDAPQSAGYKVTGILPIAVLAGIAKDLANLESFANIRELAMGWDSGDFVSWRRNKRSGKR